MQLIFLKIARDELAEIKRFYNRQQAGLGDAFQREAKSAAQLILERPLSWQIEIEPTRRFILNRFPYKMVYPPGSRPSCKATCKQTVWT